jgi:phage terminase large subunit
VTQTNWAERAQRLVKRPNDSRVIDPRAVWREQHRGRFYRYRNDPLGFARDVLRLAVWEGNEQILTSVQAHDRVAIRAGRKVSKSNSLAALALWWMLARKGRVVMTSSSFAQVKRILWFELVALNTRANLNLPMPLDPATGVWVGLSGIVGMSTDKRENMQGYSGPDVLYLADEASGIQDEILEAIEGNCAGGGKIVLAGNPTRTSGRYFDVFHNPGKWFPIHLNSETTPNVLQGEMVIPGLATRDWIEDMQAQWGIESPLYQVHVLGNFPTQSENAVIGLGLIELAKKNHPEYAPPPTVFGVDVARFGDDDSVIQPLAGSYAHQAIALRSMDGTTVAGHVMDTVARMAKGPVTVNVDVIGVGASVYDHLKNSDRAKKLRITVNAINVAERATADGYSKLRDQLWFGVRDWLRDGGTFASNPKLEAELVAPVYGFDTQGRAKVESKDDIKKRLGRSPDYADALALAVYKSPKPQTTGFSFGNDTKSNIWDI